MGFEVIEMVAVIAVFLLVFLVRQLFPINILLSREPQDQIIAKLESVLGAKASLTRGKFFQYVYSFTIQGSCGGREVILSVIYVYCSLLNNSVALLREP